MEGKETPTREIGGVSNGAAARLVVCLSGEIEGERKEEKKSGP